MSCFPLNLTVGEFNISKDATLDVLALFVSTDVTKMWYSDGVQPKQLWFEVKTNVVELKAYSRSSQKGMKASTFTGAFFSFTPSL